MKFLTSPYMMAVATIIYMVVGTVRDAYFPSTDTPVASAPTPPDGGPFLVGPPAATAAAPTFVASFAAYTPVKKTLVVRPDCDRPASVATLANRAPAADSVAFTEQLTNRPAPRLALPDEPLLLVEGL